MSRSHANSAYSSAETKAKPDEHDSVMVRDPQKTSFGVPLSDSSGGKVPTISRRPVVLLTPVFEDKLSFARLCREVTATNIKRDIWILAIDDGSTVAPPELSAIRDVGLTGAIIRLRRNSGHQAAIAIGLSYLDSLGADADIVVMDCDGEDKPSDIAALLAQLASPETQVAFASRKQRSEGLVFRGFYAAYKMIFRLLTGMALPFGNFMALSPIAVSRLVAMHETYIHLASSVLASRLVIAGVPTGRGVRYFGGSQMGFTSQVLHGLRSIVVFSETVLTRIALACLFTIGICALLAAVAAVLKLTGHASPGWFTTVIGTLIVIAMQTGVLTTIILLMTGLTKSGPPPRVRGAHIDYIREIEIIGCLTSAPNAHTVCARPNAP